MTCSAPCASPKVLLGVLQTAAFDRRLVAGAGRAGRLCPRPCTEPAGQCEWRKRGGRGRALWCARTPEARCLQAHVGDASGRLACRRVLLWRFVEHRRALRVPVRCPRTRSARRDHAGGRLPALPRSALPGVPERQRTGAGVGSDAGGAAGWRPETCVRDGPQCRRVQRRDARARCALARLHRACAQRARRLDRLGRPVRLLSDRQQRRAAGVLPSELPSARTADRVPVERSAAQLSGRAGERQDRQPDPQHDKPG